MAFSAKENHKSSKRIFKILAGFIILFFVFLTTITFVLAQKSSVSAAMMSLVIIISIAGIIGVISWSVSLDKSLFKPINFVKDYIYQVAEGQLVEYNSSIPNREISHVIEAIAKLVEVNKKTFEFAQAMGKGNFDIQYTPSGDQDQLGHALLGMRKNMLEVAEDEKKRSWANEGIAKFSELLRLDTHDIHKFSDNIITQLIKYVEANQGAFYVLNAEVKGNEHLEMTACYAWGRKKSLESKIHIGEGLLGQSVLEKETTLITRLPESYVHITSGLGDATPNCLIILPLLYNDEVFGVIEMAAFRVFEPYKVDFLNKLCVSIASSISTVKINVHTNKLLEASIQQGNELKEKDNAMRQQLEEMRAIQEEMNLNELKKRQIELKTNAILEGCGESIIGFNQEGAIEFFNSAAKEIWKTDQSKAIGKQISNFIPIELMPVDDGCIIYHITGNAKKQITGKVEMSVLNQDGEDVEILCNISRTEIGRAYFFTAFIQNITVDLF